MKNPIKVTVIGFDGPFAICSLESEEKPADVLADADFIRREGFRPGDSFLWISPESDTDDFSKGIIIERMQCRSPEKRAAMEKLRREISVPQAKIVVTDNNREYYRKLLDSIGDSDREEG